MILITSIEQRQFNEQVNQEVREQLVYKHEQLKEDHRTCQQGNQQGKRDKPTERGRRADPSAQENHCAIEEDVHQA